MSDLDEAIAQAWQTIRSKVESDPCELSRRLARRRMALLARPPRAWCLAVRASDHRINPVTACCIPEDAAYPKAHSHSYQEYDEHQVVLTARLLRTLCKPVYLDKPAEDWCRVAKKLGCHPYSLRGAREKGVVRVEYFLHLGGKSGKPTPDLYTNKPLDPCSGRLWKPADVEWGTQWRWLCEHVPDDLEQSVTRVPQYQRTRQALLADASDYEWFVGWRWICPGCRRRVKMLFYPLPCFMTLKLLAREPPPGHPDALPRPPGTFACAKCHRLADVSRLAANGWNRVVAYMSGGLLYGREVPKPAWWIPQRVREYAPRPGRAASQRSEQVRKRLLEGWTFTRIAAELGVRWESVHTYAQKVYRHHHVTNRRELARALSCTVRQPTEPLAHKRIEVERRLLDGQSYKQIALAMGVSYAAVAQHASRTYLHHCVRDQRELIGKWSTTLRCPANHKEVSAA